MNIAFYNGASGMTTYQHQLDVLSNNMANVNTIGFKGSRANFDNLLYNRMYVNTPQTMNGHGVRAVGDQLLMRQGNYVSTGEALDFCIMGEGFFAVERNGQVEYTRNGAFHIGVEDDGKAYVVTDDGAYVLDREGARIELQEKKDEVSSSSSSEDDEWGDDDDGWGDNSWGDDDWGDDDGWGETAAQPQGPAAYDLDRVQSQLGIYRIENPYGLQPTVHSSFRLTDTTGFVTAISPEPAVIEETEEDEWGDDGGWGDDDAWGEETAQAPAAEMPRYTLKRGALEQSAVNIGEQMVEVMLAQRAFQVCARVLQTADQMEETANSLR